MQFGLSSSLGIPLQYLTPFHSLQFILISNVGGPDTVRNICYVARQESIDDSAFDQDIEAFAKDLPTAVNSLVSIGYGPFETEFTLLPIRSGDDFFLAIIHAPRDKSPDLRDNWNRQSVVVFILDSLGVKRDRAEAFLRRWLLLYAALSDRVWLKELSFVYPPVARQTDEVSSAWHVVASVRDFLQCPHDVINEFLVCFLYPPFTEGLPLHSLVEILPPVWVPRHPSTTPVAGKRLPP